MHLTVTELVICLNGVMKYPIKAKEERKDTFWLWFQGTAHCGREDTLRLKAASYMVPAVKKQKGMNLLLNQLSPSYAVLDPSLGYEVCNF